MKVLKQYKTITFTSSETGNITDKMSSKANYFLKENDIGNGIDVLQDFVNKKHVEVLRDDTIKVGDGIFVLNQKERKQVGFNKTELEKIKPYYTSQQLKKYFGDSKNEYWIMYADTEVRSDINSYPNVKKHLDRFRKVLTSAFKPYGLHRPREQRFFEGEKILSLRKTKKVSFAYTDFPCYVSRAFLIIKPEDINLKYLTGLFNSDLINFWLYHKGKKQGEQLQIDKAPLLEVPIYKIDDNNKEERAIKEEIIKNVDSIIELNKKLLNVRLDAEKDLIEKQISACESKINEFIYKLFGITSNEKEVIESNK